MFASKVAKTKAPDSPTRKPAPQPSTLVARSLGGEAVEQARTLQRAMASQGTLGYLTQRFSDLPAKRPAERHDQEIAPENMTAGAAQRGAPWDFRKIPVFPPDPANRVQARSWLSAPRLRGVLQPNLDVGQSSASLAHEADVFIDPVMRVGPRTPSPPQHRQSIGDTDPAQRARVRTHSGIGLAAQPASSVADQGEYVPDMGAPERKGEPETTPEVLGREDLDSIFRTNAILRERVESVAKELGIDPGLLAAQLLAEEGPSTWSRTSGTVPSEKLGLDDWFGKNEERRLKTVIAAHPDLGLNFTDVKATGANWDTSTEKPGGAMKPRGRLDATKAVAAFGVYSKMQENLLRDVIKRKNAALRHLPIRTLDDLTPEQRLTVLRVGLNAGVGVGLKLFLQLAKGGDIPRTGKTTRDPRNASRTAVLHAARAIHLAQAIFGRSPSDYRPPAAPLSNQEAATIFDHPSLKKLPNHLIPFYY